MLKSYQTPLAVNIWGAQFSDIDVPNEIDEGKVYPEEQFSTFHHVQREDCPGFKNQTDVKHEPVYNNGEMTYPCNIGGCGKGCPVLGRVHFIVPTIV